MNNDTETTAETTTETTKKKRTLNKRSSVKLALIRELAAKLGLAPREMKSFVHFGHKGGVSVAVSQTEDVSRVYVYNTVPTVGAVVAFSKEERKNLRLGNVCAEVDFEQSAELAFEAVKNALEQAAAAPPPVKAEAKPKAEKKPARVKKTETATEQVTETDALA